MAQSVTKLIRKGHDATDIADYTLDQFVVYLNTAEQIEAEERTNFVVDVATVVGSLFSKDSPIQKHLDLLQHIRLGEQDGREPH